MRLNREFFNRNTVVVARELLGKYLVRRVVENRAALPNSQKPDFHYPVERIIIAKITETEAYCGPNDLACHASKGMTPRTKVMFGPPGRAYLYLIYGMHHCLNIVTEKEGYPAAVLIRTAELPISNYQFPNKSQIPNPKLNGPGILCRELKIDKTLNGMDICAGKGLWLEDVEKTLTSRIKKSKRKAVEYAGKWKDKLWRFSL